MGSQFKTILIQGLAADFEDGQRILAPFLFAVILLIVFNFALGNLPAELAPKLFAIEVFKHLF